jgi:ComF family protein
VGWISAAAQCVVDFLVDECCHACGARVEGHRLAPAPPLALPVPALRLGGFRITTRLLCPGCARRVRLWREPVSLALVDRSATSAGVPFPAAPASETVATANPALLVYPAFASDERLLRLIHLLKFERRERLAPWLARAMAVALPARARDGLGGPAVLVPVPMDRAARRRRGFNQAERIAVELGKRWGVPVARHAVVKRRATRPQSRLGRDERLHNLLGAFGPGPDAVRGLCPILVDDLVTTGATAAACAAVLAAGGALAVRVVCAGYRP